MNAVAKIDDNVSKLEMEAPAQPVAAPVAVAPPVLPVAPPPKKKRRAGRLLLMVALPAALIVGGSYVWVTGGRYQATENANLQQAKVSIASDTAGRIVQVAIADNQPVKQGDVLFAIDPEPYRIALAQADAAVAGARLDVEQLRATYSQATAQEKSDRQRSRLCAVAVRPRRRPRPERHQHQVVAGSGQERSRQGQGSSWPWPSRASSAPRPRLAAIPTSRPTSIRP